MAGDVPKKNLKSPTAPPPPPGGREAPFLSGEGDADLLGRRNDRLQMIGLESMSIRGDGGGGLSGSGDSGRRKTPPVIEVVAVEEERADAAGGDEGGDADEGYAADKSGPLHGDGIGGSTTDPTRDDSRSRDDPPGLISPEGDGPPPLSWIAAGEASDRIDGHCSTATGPTGEGGGGATAIGTSTSAVADGDGPSLMDEMMKEAARARSEEAEKSKAHERKAAKDASFGKGLKKGFLSCSRKKKTKGNSRRSASSAKTSGTERVNAERRLSSEQTSNVSDSLNKPTRIASRYERSSNEDEDVYELDGVGNIVKPKRHEESVPTIRPRNKTSARADADQLVFEEVQEAMRNNPLDKLNDARDAWATPDLMEKIAGNPRLTAGMTNPKYTAALEALQRSPKEAMAQFRHHPDIVDFLNEFCSVMGEHFTNIGAEQNASASGNDKSGRTPENAGPLAEEAIRRQEKMRSECGKEVPLSREEKERVDSIIADGELSRLLMDPDMQRILQECGHPGRLGYFMQHPDHGPKLRKLVDAGLFKIEQ